MKISILRALERLNEEEAEAIFEALAEFVETEREAVECGGATKLFEAATAVLGRINLDLAALAIGAVRP